jgi:multiple sugar transport system ATP-binding protein
MAAIALSRVEKSFGATHVIKGIDLAIEAGEFVVFVGPSGCGKSTLLRMIAGLESVTGGAISIGERVVNDEPPRARDIAMVFQDYALYPHKSVYDNLAFGLKIRKTPPAEIESRVREAAAILKIEHLLERKPRQLSGGQRQRVAMGRAIVRKPRAFLFDEPLSNLDALLRSEMRTEIKKLHHRLQATMVYVTHDQVEAMTLADRIVVLSAGELMQVGTPDDIYNRPASKFVAGFTGSPPMNFLKCTLQNGSIAIGDDRLAPPPGFPATGPGALEFGIRPEHVSVAFPASVPGSSIAAEVIVTEPLGSDTLVMLQSAGGEFIGRFPPDCALAPGHRLRIAFAMDRCHLFDTSTGKALH